MIMLVAMAVAIAVIMSVVCKLINIGSSQVQLKGIPHTVQEEYANEIQAKAHATHDQDELGILNLCYTISTPTATVPEEKEHSPCSETNLSMDCKNTLMPRPNSRTPLKKAPSSWIRCQPNVSALGGSVFSAT